VLGTEQIIENYLRFLCNIADITYLIIFCKVVHCVGIIGQPVSVILIVCMTISLSQICCFMCFLFPVTGRIGEVLAMGMMVLLEAMVAMPLRGRMTATALSMCMGTMVIIKGKVSSPKLYSSYLIDLNEICCLCMHGFFVW